MPKIILRRQVTDQGNHDFINLPPLLQRIYRARNVHSMGDLNKELSNLLPYTGLLNVEKAAERIGEAIQQQQRMLIIGDFDTDGATSTAVAYQALQIMGAQYVDFLVPNRFAFGYGLSPEIVDLAAMKQPNLIITVDNGISSIEGVDKANATKIDVIITDHHLPGHQLPNAYAIVDPNQPNDSFSSKNLAGVGVIFYVMLAVRAYLEKVGWFELQAISRPNMAQFLDLVALGTVADLVPLDKNNRIIVHQGLQRIRSGHIRPGILALLKVANRNYLQITAADFGFVLGPRLNAAGRLDDMSLGIQCLLATDSKTAMLAAQQLDQLNQERRVLESHMQQEAWAIIQQLDLNLDCPNGICLYDETWHQGIIGLVASKVKEKINRPVIAFAKAEEGVIKGSARSIAGVHIRDILAIIAAEYPNLINKFGGHAMAAGLSLNLENYKKFTEVFTETIAKHCGGMSLQHNIFTDGELQIQECTYSTAELLRNSGPWGQEFPEPIFDGIFKLIDSRVVGGRHLKMTLQMKEAGQNIEAIAFNTNLEKLDHYQSTDTLQIVYRLDINEYQGKNKLQLIVEEILN